MHNHFQNNQRPGAGPPPVQMQRGRYFQFALPAGWQVQENSNALCLTAPDGSASIMTVGLVGMMQPFTPDQFMHYILNMHQMMIVRILGGQAIPPDPGCSSAGLFDILYACNGHAARAIVTCQIAVGYNQCSGTMRMAAAQEQAWDQYRDWLPQAAAQVAPAGSHTYMASTVAANDRASEQALAQRWHEVNNHIENLHQQTTNERWASQDRQNFEFRENLGAVATYYNPYDNRLVEMPTQYNYYWVNRQGQVYGTNDPRDDPRVGSTEDWTEMGRYRPR